MCSSDHEKWMLRCLELAALGAGSAAPNPLVGAILVLNDKVLAEGWHHKAGAPHAEVECLRAFGDAPVPTDAIMYVNLEPCAHHGRTPPCATLLVERGVRHVVIGQRDPFPEVAGKGISVLHGAGISIVEGVLVDQCSWVQRRFLTSVERSRPYVIVKWARSADGFLDQHPRTDRTVQRISSPATNVLVHRWRSEEQAILVGSRTVLNDDPSLTVRHVHGRQPLRLVLDRKGITPSASRVFDGSFPTLLFTGRERPDLEVEQLLVPADAEPIKFILDALHQRSIRSILVEGGAELLGHFMHGPYWDEARVITSTIRFSKGTPAPTLSQPSSRTLAIDDDRIDLFVNPDLRSHLDFQPRPEWAW